MEELEKQRWHRMIIWLKDVHGMDISERGFHVEARAVEGAGRGLFSLRDCPRGTTLFKVPFTALMNCITVGKLYPQLREHGLSGIHLVSLHLLLHRPSGDYDSTDPSFGPYISTLPRNFSSHPLTWMVKRNLKQEDVWERRILSILPPSVIGKLFAVQKRFWDDWKIVSGVLVEDREILVQTSKAMSPFVNKDATLILDYLWAWLNVNTRCIFYRIRGNLSDPDNFTLCPVLDLANHRHGHTHIFPVVDSKMWSVVDKKLPKYFTFFGPSQDVISKGQELYLQYGNHSNHFLFVEYGFVDLVPKGNFINGERHGQVDVQELVEPLFTEKGSLGTQMRIALEADGYWGDWTIHSTPTPAHPSYRLVVTLRLLHAVREDAAFESVLRTWRDVTNGHADHISLQNEEQWRQSLLHICEQIINRAQTGLNNLSAPEIGHWTNNVMWRKRIYGDVEALWTEEREVAEAVRASVLSGVDF